MKQWVFRDGRVLRIYAGGLAWLTIALPHEGWACQLQFMLHTYLPVYFPSGWAIKKEAVV